MTSHPIKKHILAVLVENEFGVLARIVELFSARGYNIESLTVAPVSRDKKMSRITITTYGTDKTIELICKLLRRIIPVHHAAELSAAEGYIERELALIQIITDKKTRKKAVKFLEDYESKIIDEEADSLVFEVIGDSQIIEEVLEKMENFGLATVSRTGIAAGFRGMKRLDQISG
ncbi:MAG: acetolactate synthase small subunit [Alphaproteobacteria bacterium]|nr:acetolactate synthase small subunit [Alphaproteobacteria bacterium]